MRLWLVRVLRRSITTCLFIGVHFFGASEHLVGGLHHGQRQVVQDIIQRLGFFLVQGTLDQLEQHLVVGPQEIIGAQARQARLLQRAVDLVQQIGPAQQDAQAVRLQGIAGIYRSVYACRLSCRAAAPGCAAGLRRFAPLAACLKRPIEPIKERSSTCSRRASFCR